jgi:Flp pilus assembly protein TadG
MRSAAHRRALAGDGGSVTLTTLLVLPPLMLTFLAALQAALVWHAHDIATAAAQQASAAARAVNGSDASGQQAGDAFLAHAAGQLLDHPTVTVTRSATTTTVTVTGTALGILDQLHLHVRVTVVSPTERFVPDTSGSAP